MIKLYSTGVVAQMEDNKSDTIKIRTICRGWEAPSTTSNSYDREGNGGRNIIREVENATIWPSNTSQFKARDANLCLQECYLIMKAMHNILKVSSQYISSEVDAHKDNRHTMHFAEMTLVSGFISKSLLIIEKFY